MVLNNIYAGLQPQMAHSTCQTDANVLAQLEQEHENSERGKFIQQLKAEMTLAKVMAC
jgi:hypothetical protein